MIKEDNLIFINEVISAIDSFQQDYGTFHYSITIQSYALHHQLTVAITDTKSFNSVKFVIEKMLYEKALIPSEYIYKIPSEYIYNLIKVKSEELKKIKEEFEE